MLDKLRGIKPTHLWHLTSRKALYDAIKDRQEARKDMGKVLNRRNVLTMAAIVWSSTLGIFYSYGMFAPEKVIQHVMPPPCKSADPPVDIKDTCKKPPPPAAKVPACPPPKSPPPKSKPC